MIFDRNLCNFLQNFLLSQFCLVSLFVIKYYMLDRNKRLSKQVQNHKFLKIGAFKIISMIVLYYAESLA